MSKAEEVSESIVTDTIESTKLTDVPGLGPKTAKLLIEGKIDNPKLLMETSLDALEILGLTRPAAQKLKNAVADMFPEIYGTYTPKLSLEDIEGIGPTTAKALREKGMNISLLEATPVKELEERYGITSTAAQKYQTYISDTIRGGYFTTGLEVYTERLNQQTFTFGADSLDKLTFVAELGNGGVRCGETYEFFGAFRSGKSQICHQLAVTVQLPEELGGLGKKAIYIDSEGTFSPSRIAQIVARLQEEKGWDKSPQDVLKDIMYARVRNSDVQQAVVVKLLEILGSSDDEFGVVLVDSVSAHFRAEYSGRGTLAERQQTLNAHLNALHRVGDTYNLAIVVTNQVQANPAQFFGDPTTAVGGNIMGHWAGTRFYLRKSKGEKRVIRVFDSPNLPEIEAVFEITEAGVMSTE